MRELVAVIIISVTVATIPLQILGFITPYWACGEIQHTSNNYYYRTTTQSYMYNESCDLNGIFYTCAGSGCHGSVFDSSLLGLCLTSLIVTCGTAGYMIKIFKDKMFMNGLVDWTLALNAETVMFGIFVIGQFLAGVAAIIMFSKYQVMGWSAILFTTLALPIVFIASIIVSILVAVCLCAIFCRGDDD